MFYDKTEHLNFFFDAIEKTRGVMQQPLFHPEGDVFNHSLQSLHLALRETKDIDLIFAAMLHDVGKMIEGYGHEQHSIDILGDIISEKTRWLILNHMKVWYFLLGDMKKWGKVRSLVKNQWLPDLVHLARIDKMARRNTNQYVKNYNRHDLIERIYKVIS